MAFCAGVFRIFSCFFTQKATKNLGQTRPLLAPLLWGRTRAPRSQNSAFRCFIGCHSRVAPPKFQTPRRKAQIACVYQQFRYSEALLLVIPFTVPDSKFPNARPWPASKMGLSRISSQVCYVNSFLPFFSTHGHQAALLQHSKTTPKFLLWFSSCISWAGVSAVSSS